MMRKSWHRRIALIAAATLPSQAAADILVVSQNTLHLGQGERRGPAYIAGKNSFVQILAAWPGNRLPQLTFLQEVMEQADESDIAFTGATVRFGILKGRTSYVERYGVMLVNDTGNHVGILCHVDTTSLIPAGTVVDRPPEATLVSDTSSGSARHAWLLNFHATFGSGRAPRRAEAAEVGRIVTRLRAAIPAGCPRTSDNVVVLGDWNLPGTDPGFQALAANAGFVNVGIAPDALTSLNRPGRRASAYDHFVWDQRRVTVTLADLRSQPLCGTNASFVRGVLTPIDLTSFFQRCSDHLSVAAVVRILR